MMRKGVFLAMVWAAALLTAGCASETWDNPYDPEAAAYRGPCAGVPDAFAEGCVFWEDFDNGLSRWLVTPSPAGIKPIRIAAQSEDGEPKVLALPGCAGKGAPGLQAELDLPHGNLQLMVYWRNGPESSGELALSLNGAEQAVTTELAGEAGYENWSASLANVTPLSGRTVILRLENRGGEGAGCAEHGIHVARVHLRALEQ